MPRHTSAAEPAPAVRIVIVTMDNHLASATDRARATLAAQIPGLSLCMHAAAEWDSDPAALERCRADIARGDIIVSTMLFMDDHIQAVLPALQARREHCDAMVCCMSAAEVTRLTRMGRFDMDARPSGALAFLKRLRPKAKAGADSGSGARQMRMLRRLPKILRFIPGTAQDVRAYFLTLQYWLAVRKRTWSTWCACWSTAMPTARAAACAARSRTAAGRVPRGRRLSPAPARPHRRVAPRACRAGARAARSACC